MKNKHKRIKRTEITYSEWGGCLGFFVLRFFNRNSVSIRSQKMTTGRITDLPRGAVGYWPMFAERGQYINPVLYGME